MQVYRDTRPAQLGAWLAVFVATSATAQTLLQS